MYHDGTIGVRCPDDHVAADLLTQAPLPVVAASANLAGNPAPVTAQEALADLEGRVDLVLDGGRSRYGKASTIVQVRADGSYEVLREGVLDERTIRRMNRTSFLVVCSGNTCRSPMAAGILRRLLAEKLGCREDELTEKGYHVESAGTGAYSGAPATPEAVEALRSKGIDISGHRSQPLTLEQVNRADYIFAMTGRQVENVKSLAGHVENRVLKVDDEDIEDPIGGSEEEYVSCANRIEEALRRRLEEVVL
jgi:protein-tyrosine phosphatase